MKLKKNSTKVVNPKPIAIEEKHQCCCEHCLITNSTTSQEMNITTSCRIGKSVRDTLFNFKFKKRKTKTADSDTYGAVDFDNALNSNESRGYSSTVGPPLSEHPGTKSS